MKKIIIAALFASLLLTACSSASTNIFGKKTPLEKYEEKLEDSGLEKTPEGRQWLAASHMALQHPVPVQLPYSQAGNFSAKKPQALGLQFVATHGERLTFAFNKTEGANFVLYAELYKQDVNGRTDLLQSPDTNVSEFSFDIPETGGYLLKIQPQLFRAGSYTLSVSTGPSLSFPVAGKKPYIGSVWGDERDGGKRSHEGVDIFATKGTPAIAAADGFIANVREGGIGGKTVWLRPTGQNITLYYAHLDEQLVHEGQAVKKGDTVGLVGNTGNAKNTPSHLHFGIYGRGGAVDPNPFVNRQVKSVPAIPQKKMEDYVRLLKDVNTAGIIATKNTLLMPLAATAKGYVAELPDGRVIATSFASVQAASQPIKKSKAVAETALYHVPVNETTISKMIPAGSSVSVLGYYNQFAFVQSGEKKGWVLESFLKG